MIGAARAPRLRSTWVLLILTSLALGLLAGVTPGPAAPAAAADIDASPALPAAGHPWFGPGLSLDSDDPASYADRLGAEPALYTVPVGYPLSADDRYSLDRRVGELAAQGAVAVIDLQPRLPLDQLTAEDATELAEALVELDESTGTYFLLRFASEMNGTWKTWGQQPQAYVAAFRTVAAAVHRTTDQAAMVWAPVYGSGYPFGRSYGRVDPAGSRRAAQLDTNGDRRVTEADDPYGPYWPGAASVDWVGLTLYRLGQAQGRQVNTAPAAGEYEARLAERWGYGDRGSRRSFYDRFAAGADKPMLVETSSGYNPAVGGATEVAIKRSWWRQVLAADAGHPMVRAISWLEQQRVEPEVDDDLVDWRATRTRSLASALRADLRAGGGTLGPVTERVDPDETESANEATAQGRIPGLRYIGDSMGWIVGTVTLLALVLLLSGLVGRLVPGWHYDETGSGGSSGSRDLRIDLFRGWLICTVVITHTELAGLYSFVTLNAVGAVTGAEGFVMLSGVVLGMVHRAQMARLGEWAAAVLRWRRARKIYVVALAVTLLVWVIGKIPGVDATVVTTFTDRGTGSAGPAAKGQVYDLYANADRLFDYPPPWYAARSFLLLEIGPWVLNVLGLFVILIALAPAFMWLMKRGLWWVVLALSWAAYLYDTWTDVHWLPSQFEAVFPLLIWQVAFVHGMVLGYYRREVVAALTTRAGKVLTTLLVLAYAGGLAWLWAWHTGAVPGPWPADAYGWAYDHLFVRVDLQPGRLVDLALVAVVAFAFLSTCWRPVHRAFGWFLVPLGQASLYVFIVHVFLVLAVGNLPGLDRTSWWQGALVHTAVVLLLFVMVRRRFLFSVIPR
jgi:hypothetical protein